MKPLYIHIVLWGAVSLVGLALLTLGVRELFPKVKLEVRETVREVPVLVQAPPPAQECMTFSLVGMDDWGDYLTVAETELCGVALRWSKTAYGPSLEARINNLENELAAWRDCAESRLLCTKEQLEEIQ